jgi:mRNA interferase RelE/StbE
VNRNPANLLKLLENKFLVDPDLSDYTIVFTRSARKELQALPQSIAERILDKVELLTSNPRPPDCKKLQGASHLWRIRVGDYRVIYNVIDENQVVDILVIRHRKEAYR